MHDVESELRQIFAAVFRIDPAAVTDELTYECISEWDSLSHLLLIEAIEQQFGIRVGTHDTIEMRSFAKAKAIVTKHLGP